jgi:tRNA-splicing ligase RtcB (3'-phosphate/5'-hydroxy nucleic acid ligase)
MRSISEHEHCIEVEKSYSPGMKTSAIIYVDEELRRPLFDELSSTASVSSINQIADVCSLPALVGKVVGLPDIHTGYGFPIGCVAAFDINNPECVVSPGGVGYDINCGVRALRTNLDIGELRKQEELVADELFRLIPTGMGNDKGFNTTLKDLNAILDAGMEYLVRRKQIPEEDAEHTEDGGAMRGSSHAVNQKAKGRGLNQLGSLGSGNHYLEVQYVETIYDGEKAEAMGLREGQVVVMIHTGSRGLGHSVCHSSLMAMTEGKEDSQLGTGLYSSREAQDYIAAMGSAANFAFVNRSIITMKTREAFRKAFERAELEVIYDVCHNIAKEERHRVNGVMYDVLVHRKGASRALPPYHPLVPSRYKAIGQPVMIGGSMGTCSYILCGADGAMDLIFGSTCHGAGRVLSRNRARSIFTHEEIADCLRSQGIVFRCASSLGMVEEAPGSYKDIDRVVDLSDAVGLTRKVCRLRPCLVIKG